VRSREGRLRDDVLEFRQLAQADEAASRDVRFDRLPVLTTAIGRHHNIFVSKRRTAHDPQRFRNAEFPPNDRRIHPQARLCARG
jgi:hypothetical protein